MGIRQPPSSNPSKATFSADSLWVVWELWVVIQLCNEQLERLASARWLCSSAVTVLTCSLLVGDLHGNDSFTPHCSCVCSSCLSNILWDCLSLQVCHSQVSVVWQCVHSLDFQAFRKRFLIWLLTQRSNYKSITGGGEGKGLEIEAMNSYFLAISIC